MPGYVPSALVVALSLVALGCSTASTVSDATVSDATVSDATVSDATGSTTIVESPTTASPSAASTDATTAPSSAAEPTGVQPEGFTTAQVMITSADGEVCEVCVWLADEADERSRGLMGVTDLGDAAGMLFAYAEDTAGNFFMFNTPTPLSIAWFARDGRYLAETDMEPCLTDDSGTCPRYSPGGPFAFALEVFEGDLVDLGVGPGATLALVPGSEALTCADPPAE